MKLYSCKRIHKINIRDIPQASDRRRVGGGKGNMWEVLGSEQKGVRKKEKVKKDRKRGNRFIFLHRSHLKAETGSTVFGKSKH